MFKRLERVEFVNFQDFGKVVRVYGNGRYLVVPDGSDQHWGMTASELKRIETEA